MANPKPIPIMASVFLQATASGVTWWATDLDLWRGGAIEADVEQEGAGLVPAALALGFLKRCQADDVRLTFSEKGVTLAAGGFSVRLPTFPLEDYPTRPTIPTQGGVEIGGEAIFRLVGHVLTCVNETSGHYYVRGALITVTSTDVMLSAVDGHRLARSTVGLDTSAGAVADAILPKKALVELRSLVERDPAARVTYCADGEGRYVFRVGSSVIVACAVDAQFPNLERVTPKNWKTRLTCSREMFDRMLARVVLAASEGSAVTIEIADGAVTVSARSADKGEATERISAAIEGKPLVFGMNGRYIRDFLTSTDADTIMCECTTPDAPAMFRPVGQDGFCYVISPMRI